MDEIRELPGLDPDTRDYYRDVYDHLIRISDLIDSYRDLLSGAMDVYLSTVSNRLNVVMKQLTIVATVFLPITALTGFFGQNFGVLVRYIQPTVGVSGLRRRGHPDVHRDPADLVPAQRVPGPGRALNVGVRRTILDPLHH